MADNSTLPATGESIATDDIGGTKFQRIKLVHGADGTNDGDVSATNPLPVRTGAFDVATSITRPADTTAYASGDCFSDSTSAPTSGGFTLSGVVRASGGSGVLTDLVITSSAPASMQGRVWLFNQAATNKNDNSAISLSDADILNVVGVYPFQLSALTNCSFVHLQNLAKVFKCSGSDDLRFLIEVTAAYTPISGEVLQVRASGLMVD